MFAHLPSYIALFIPWYFVTFPVKLWRSTFRLVSLLNNEMSFTLNLRLLFTPLFGDYTKVGRLIGFLVRIVEIFFGILTLIVMSLLAFILPMLWVVLPLIIVLVATEYFYLLLYLPILFVALLYFNRDVPLKRAKQISGINYEDAMRPETRAYFESIVSTSQLTVELMSNPKVVVLLKRLELSSGDFTAKITSIPIDSTTLAKDCLEIALEAQARYIEVEHLFLGAVSILPKSDILLATYGTNFTTCRKAVHWIVSQREELSRKHFWQDDFVLPKMSGVGKGMTGHVTPFLDSISKDFTAMAQSGKFRKILSHKALIKEVTELIGSSTVNVLLVGPPGCGKTSIVQGIAQRIVEGTDIEAIRFKRIVAIDTSSLLAGTKTAGEVAERINKLMQESKSSSDIILFFDEIHNLISGANTEDGSAIFSLLEPHLVDSNIQFIGATNLENYRKYIEPNGSFSRLFQKVEIPPTSDEETLQILEDVARDKEIEYGVVISFPALEETLKLSKKLIHDRVFPDKALDILDRTIAEVRQKSKYITVSHVREQISSVTHVPVSNLSEDESKKLLEIESKIKARVIGQDHAVTQIAKALQRARAGIRDENKPIASFLFVGTTGVGKTETAKALAAEYFGDPKAMIRLDMSEYQQQDSISRLLGDPNGRSKGILTEAVRSRPFALVLLDEIEKANSNILLTFLQVLDDGRLTDASGTTVDFTNTIIIATSNVGTKAIQEVVSRDGTFEEMTETALKAVRDHYAPEFLNRFTSVIVYNPLRLEHVKLVADLMLNKVRRIAAEKNITLTFSPDLIDELVNKGFNKDWGARSMSRVVEDNVESYLAVKLLSGEIKQGDVLTLGKEVFYI